MTLGAPLRVAAFILAVATTGSAHAQLSSPPDAREIKRMEAREVVLRSHVQSKGVGKAGFSRAYAIINATPDQCWEDVLDYESYLQLTPRLREFRIQQRTANDALVWQRYGVAFYSFSFTLRVTFEHTERRLAWALDKSRPTNVDEVDGSIQYLPHTDGRSLMVYDIRLESGIWTPAFVQDWVTRRDLLELVDRVRTRAEARAARARAPR